MATVSSYTLGDGAKRYRVRYRTPDHRQTDKRGFTTKRAAEAFAATVEVEKMRGEYVPPSLGRVTVAELGPAWLERKEAELKASAYRPLETAWRVHVEPHWGRTRIADIKLGAVETWVAEMQRTVKDPVTGEVQRKGRGATVVIRAFGVLAAILDTAVKDGRLSKNPARGVENLPRKPKKKAGRRYLTAADVHTLADNCTAEDKRILVLMLGFTGLRWGEAIALTVNSIDFLRKRISVTRNAVQVGQKHHMETPKTHEARSVPLPAFLAAELSTLCEGKSRSDLLFRRADGGHLRRPVSRTSWLEFAADRAGLERLTPHDLRHSSASIAISAGANVLALSRMLGHASAAMTLDVYSDLFDSDLDALGIALDHVGTAPSVGKTWAQPPSAENR